MLDSPGRPLTRTGPPLDAACPPDPLLTDLLAAHGELIGGADLAHCLGFKTPRAFQKAASARRLPVQTFSLNGRRGRFARTRDLAAWLASLAPPLGIDTTRPETA